MFMFFDPNEKEKYVKAMAESDETLDAEKLVSK